MAEYSLTAKALSLLGGSFRSASADSFAAWASFVDSVGPQLVPFLVRPECFDSIPYAALGLPPVKLGELVPRSEEVWVLFCYRKAFRDSAPAGSPLRSDGFPLVLEWRRDETDSELLSKSFHSLASLVRSHLGVSGWGIHPAYGRYGDNVAFLDVSLFGDAGDADVVASAYGALLAGLECATTGRRLPFWPFPTFQWNDADECVAGVAGLAEKISVAADCEASVVMVARGQLRMANRLLQSLRRVDKVGKYGRMSVLAAGPERNPRRLAREIRDVLERRRWRRRLLLFGMCAAFVALAAVSAWVWDCRRELTAYYADYVDRFGIAEGRFAVSPAEVAGRNRAYMFVYRGYDRLSPWNRRRVLRSMWCIDGNGRICMDENEYPEHRAVTGMEFRYDEKGVIAETVHYGPGRRVLDVYRYSGRRANIADVIGECGSLATTFGGLRFASSVGGDLVTRIVYDRDGGGYVTKKAFHRDTQGEAAASSAGVSSLSFALLPDGRIRELRRLDWQDRPATNSVGVHLERYEYIGANLARTRLEDAGGRPVGAMGQEDERVCMYSDAGCLTQVECRVSGRLSRRLTYERLADCVVVSESRMPPANGASSGAWTSKVTVKDLNGNAVRETFGLADGRRPLRRDGQIASVARRFDSQGRMTEEVFYDENDAVMRNPAEGWAARKMAYEALDDGYVMWRRYFGEDMLPTLLPDDQIALERKEFDSRGRVRFWELFGDGDKPVDSAALGWHKAVMSYGRDGRRTVRFYDVKGSELPYDE